MEIIKNNRAAIDSLVGLLIEKETMDGEEFCEVLSEFTVIPEKDRFMPVLPDQK